MVLLPTSMVILIQTSMVILLPTSVVVLLPTLVMVLLLILTSSKTVKTKAIKTKKTKESSNVTSSKQSNSPTVSKQDSSLKNVQLHQEGPRSITRKSADAHCPKSWKSEPTQTPCALFVGQTLHLPPSSIETTLRGTIYATPCGQVSIVF
jgi:hypothetical protein